MNKKIEKVNIDPLLMDVGQRYVHLEQEIRTVIDKIVAPVCSTCAQVCCQPSYCRETLRNPWYLFLHKQFGDSRNISWERRNPPPGLGPKGCVIRAGRYAYCYAYNCRMIREQIGSEKQISVFQEISDLLKNLGLCFAGKRHLTDVRSWVEITPERLNRLNKKIEEGTARFHELCSLLFITEPG